MSAPEPLARELSGLIRKAQAEWPAPSVSAAVAHKGEVVWGQTLGVANTETRDEATPDHQYRIGSITKTFTSVAIMQLRDAGKLDLEDPLDRHLAGVPHQPTIRRMLSHSSGLQREPPGDVWETMRFTAGEEFLASAAEAEQVLPPGSYFHYSNLAFALLGEVVARVSGQSWEQYLAERVLQPLGMTRTSVQRQAPAAQGYFVDPYSDTVHEEPSELDIGSTAPAGALWSTPADLARWAAFFSDPSPDVLSGDTVEEMQTFQTMADHERWRLGFGLGLQLFRDGDRIFAGHGGAMPGFLAMVVASRKEGTGAILLTNSGAAKGVQDLAIELAVKAAVAYPAEPELWTVRDAAPAELEGVPGRWWSEGGEWIFRWRGGELVAEPDTTAETVPTRFRRESEDLYRAITGSERGEQLRIVRDDDGTVTRMYFATYPFTRTPETFQPG
ncbi:MAG: beta-lactamase family protein [Actinomycetota bacterium]|nr:beta-lactamase family protein [Actinomycetota bacterium]